MRTEIKISGYGGQGIVTLSILIVSGINLDYNKYYSQTEAYGPQTSGGDCWSEIVFDDTVIDYPRIIQADYAILLSQVAFNSFANEVKEGGSIFIDPASVVVPQQFRDNVVIYRIPAQHIASEKFGSILNANIILFGAFTYMTNILSVEAARKVIATNISEKTFSVKLSALEQGFTLGKEITTARSL